MRIIWAAAAGLSIALGASAAGADGRDTPEGSRVKHRMGTLVVRTSPGARVSVRQVRHEFWFGSAVGTGPFAGKLPEADRARCLAVLKENFNAAVHENAMKWAANERGPGRTDYREADAILKWCEENGLRMRGHCVFWGVERFIQNWVKGLDDAALRGALERRALDVVSRYRGRIAEFDVNNEMLRENYYAKRLGAGNVKDMFLWCRQANPDAVLYVNDYGILTSSRVAGADSLDQYERQIESFLAAGVPVGGIGLQGHFGGRVNRERVTRVLDRLSRFNLPIKITEFDMKTLDERAKAEGLETLYRTCFEHPAVDGILMWGFWAKAHWLSTPEWGIAGYTALWDADWNPMPAAEAYRRLVFQEWWTRFEGTADAQGICETPVFFGRHKAAVPGGEAEVEVLKSRPRVEIRLPPAP